jgi:uncharacterized protein (TIGR02001 family)
LKGNRKVKKTAIGTALCLAVLMFFTESAIGADATAGVDINSAYVWRGITFNDGVVIQPSIDVAKGGFGLNVWGNLDLDDYNNTLEDGEFSEIDLTLSYGHSLESVDVSIGYIEYLFPAGGEGTREIFAGAAISPTDNLSAGIDIYYDIDEVDDIYASLSLGYGITLSEQLGMEIGASAGYAGEDASAGEDSGLHDYNLYVSASYAASDALSIGATLGYVDSFDDDVLPDQDVDLYGGINLMYAF